MRVELVRGFGMKALDCRFFDRAVHAFNLAVGPEVGRPDEALLDVPLGAELPNRVTACVGVMRPVMKRNTFAGQYFMCLVRNLEQDPAQEFHGNGLGGVRV